MARTSLAIQSVSIAGIAALAMTAPAGSGAGNGALVAIGGNKRTILVVNNASAGVRTFTIPNVGGSKVNGVTLPSLSLTVTNGNGVPGIIWLPLDYVDPATGAVAVDIDTLTSVTWAAVQVPENYQ